MHLATMLEYRSDLYLGHLGSSLSGSPAPSTSACTHKNRAFDAPCVRYASHVTMCNVHSSGLVRLSSLTLLMCEERTHVQSSLPFCAACNVGKVNVTQACGSLNRKDLFARSCQVRLEFVIQREDCHICCALATFLASSSVPLGSSKCQLLELESSFGLNGDGPDELIVVADGSQTPPQEHCRLPGAVDMDPMT